jgi:hypothetical protein
MTRTDLIRTDIFDINDELGFNLSGIFKEGLTPDIVVRAYFDPKLKKLYVDTFTPEGLKFIKSPKFQQDKLPFDFDPNYVYLQGLVKKDGVLISGADLNAYARFQDLIQQVIVGLDHVFTANFVDYRMTLFHLPRPIEYFVRGTNNVWRVIKALTLDFDWVNNLLVAAFDDSNIKAIKITDIDTYVQTGKVVSMPVQYDQIQGQVIHLESIGDNRWVATTDTGMVYNFGITWVNNVLKVVEIKSLVFNIGAAIKTHLGNMWKVPYLQASVIDITKTRGVLAIHRIAA